MKLILRVLLPGVVSGLIPGGLFQDGKHHTDNTGLPLCTRLNAASQNPEAEARKYVLVSDISGVHYAQLEDSTGETSELKELVTVLGQPSEDGAQQKINALAVCCNMLYVSIVETDGEGSFSTGRVQQYVLTPNRSPGGFLAPAGNATLAVADVRPNSILNDTQAVAMNCNEESGDLYVALQVNEAESEVVRFKGEDLYSLVHKKINHVVYEKWYSKPSYITRGIKVDGYFVYVADAPSGDGGMPNRIESCQVNNPSPKDAEHVIAEFVDDVSTVQGICADGRNTYFFTNDILYATAREVSQHVGESHLSASISAKLGGNAANLAPVKVLGDLQNAVSCVSDGESSIYLVEQGSNTIWRVTPELSGHDEAKYTREQILPKPAPTPFLPAAGNETEPVDPVDVEVSTTPEEPEVKNLVNPTAIAYWSYYHV